MTSPLTGLILAGGRSRRMGANKALCHLAGRPLLAHVIERLAPQCRPLLLSANADRDALAPFGLPILSDADPDRPGPLAGILAGLDHTAADAGPRALLLSVSVDCPWLPPDLVARLAAAREREGSEIALASSGGQLHPTVALWPVSIREDLRRHMADGLRAVRGVLAHHRSTVVAWPTEPVDPFFNLNTPADLATAEAVLATSRTAPDLEP